MNKTRAKCTRVKMMNKNLASLAMIALMLGMAFAGCLGGDDTTDDDTVDNTGTDTTGTNTTGTDTTGTNSTGTDNTGTNDGGGNTTTIDVGTITCGPDGSIAIAGSSTVLPLAEAWAQYYDAACPGISITVEGGGSSSGAGRVCANSEKGTPVEIGDMSRDWKSSEADRGSDGYTMSCLKGDTTRKAIQLVVANDGLSVVMKKGGAAESCVNSLGGLTVDQLRYIFSSKDMSELIADGWDSSSLSNVDSDNDREWSDLSADCADSAIVLAYPDAESGTFEYFCEAIMNDDCSFGTGTQSADDNVLVNSLTGDGAAVAYFGYAYYVENTDILTASPVKNADGNYVAPSATSVADGTYNPLSRPLFMNLNVGDLSKTKPFLEFGYGDGGDTLVSSVGYVPLISEYEHEMRERLEGPGPDVGTITCGPDGSIAIAGSSTVLPLAEAWAQYYDAACPGISITVEGGGSSSGAGRVCANSEKGTPVEIGDMSRDWKSSEADRAFDGYTMSCLKGDTTRKAIQVEVAKDGLSAVMKKGGDAESCVNSLGGLTVDQLRWIFSSKPATELAADGWDSSSLANADSDETREWSDLSSDCADAQIAVSYTHLRAHET